MEYLFLVLGLMFGSFANVIIYRLPREESIVKPRSHCPQCKKMIPWYLNIPVISWFLLRGRCAFCSNKISIRYPIVELMMGLLFYLAFIRWGISWNLVEALLLYFGLVTVSFIDLDHMILPDSFTLGGIVIGFMLSFVNPDRSWVDSLIGLLTGGGSLWMVAYLYYLWRKEEGMGGGDIKLLAWVGAFSGWTAIPFVILTGSVLGAFVGGGYALIKKSGMKTAIPFGPFLAFGALLYHLGGEAVTQSYWKLFFPWMVL